MFKATDAGMAQQQAVNDQGVIKNLITQTRERRLINMEGKRKGFRQLTAWQKAYELALEVYRISKTFPKEEMYGLVSQLRRAASSVPANIAEGYERNHRKEYVQFLYIAKGSLGEIETYILLSSDLEYISQSKYNALDALRSESSRVLQGLIRSLS